MGIAEFAPRAVCSDVERRAAVWAHDDLRARGHEAWMETHWVRPQLALGLALGCALAAVGGLVAIGAPVAGLVVAAVGAVSVLLDVSGRTGPLRMLLPRRATQVVLVAPREGAAVDLLVVARTDVPRRGLAARLERVPGGCGGWRHPRSPSPSQPRPESPARTASPSASHSSFRPSSSWS